MTETPLGMDAIEAAPSARGWAAALARYELVVLAELGFGLDLERCVVTGGEEELAFVSPRSGGAVSRGAAYGYEAKLFALPPFLREAADRVLEGARLVSRLQHRFREGVHKADVSDMMRRLTKEELYRAGATYASMSGSGPSARAGARAGCTIASSKPAFPVR